MTLEDDITAVIVTNSFPRNFTTFINTVSYKRPFQSLLYLYKSWQQLDDTGWVNNATNIINSAWASKTEAWSWWHTRFLTALQCWSKNQLIKRKAVMSVGALMCKKTSKRGSGVFCLRFCFNCFSHIVTRAFCQRQQGRQFKKKKENNWQAKN